VIPLRPVLAAALLLAGSLSAHADNRELSKIAGNFVNRRQLRFPRRPGRGGRRLELSPDGGPLWHQGGPGKNALKLSLGIPFTWLPWPSCMP
jgi:hypothetical protein